MRTLSAEIADRAEAGAGVTSAPLRRLLQEPVAAAAAALPAGPLLFARATAIDRVAPAEATA